MIADKSEVNLVLIAPGMKKEFAGAPLPELTGLKSITFVASRELEDQELVRHGGKVRRALYFKMHSEKGEKYLLIYLTADNLITDEDVVND